MTENFEDMQAKYRDKGAIKAAAVPLAADAAHLLSEYLDNLAIQLVRAGIDEPYRITQEYEEIFVQELQRLGTSSKLTYDITATMLERYGTPAQLVKQYVTDQQPVLHDLVGSTWRTRLEGETTRSLIGKTITYGYFAFMIGAMLLMTGSLVQPQTSLFYLYEPLVATLYAFAFLELVTGIRGTSINIENYEVLRTITRFLVTSNAIVMSWIAFDIGTATVVFNEWPQILYGWIVLMTVGYIRDHTPYLKSSNMGRKPLARFILPSYIFTGLAIFFGAITLLVDDNLLAYPDDTTQMTLTFSLLLALSSLFIEIRRKYPISIQKLAFTIFSFPLLIIYVFSYEVRTRSQYYDWGYGEYITSYSAHISYDFVAIAISLLLWFIPILICLPLIFRKEISSQLKIYKQQLSEYQKHQ